LLKKNGTEEGTRSSHSLVITIRSNYSPSEFIAHIVQIIQRLLPNYFLNVFAWHDCLTSPEEYCHLNTEV